MHLNAHGYRELTARALALAACWLVCVPLAAQPVGQGAFPSSSPPLLSSQAVDGAGLVAQPDGVAGTGQPGQPGRAPDEPGHAAPLGAADQPPALALMGLRVGRDIQRGMASWYGLRFQGRTTASGERFDMHGLTAAHRTLPFGTRVLVHSLRTGKEVVVRINDRGPYARNRVIDLSHAAAAALGLKRHGHALVVLRELLPADGPDGTGAGE